jgi:hypothetical protein
MPTALVIGARNLGFGIIERVQAAGATGIEVDATDQASVLAVLEKPAELHGRVD